MSFPISPDGLKKEEIAMILTKALRFSDIKSVADLARTVGMKRRTISDYFNARRRPPQHRWNALRNALVTEEGPFVEIQQVEDEIDFNCSKEELEEIIKHSEEMKSALALLMEEAAYFKDKPAKARIILKKRLPKKEVGYAVSLLEALYSENELEILKTFTEED